LTACLAKIRNCEIPFNELTKQFIYDLVLLLRREERARKAANQQSAIEIEKDESDNEQDAENFRDLEYDNDDLRQLCYFTSQMLIHTSPTDKDGERMRLKGTRIVNPRDQVEKTIQQQLEQEKNLC